MPSAKPSYIPADQWGQNGCLVRYNIGNSQVNSYSNGPVVGNDPTGTPWSAPPRQAASWPFQIFPYVEQQSVQNLQAGMVRNVGLPVFVCPTRRGLVTFRSNANNNGGRPLDYAAPYFGPASRATNDIKNNPASFYGIIVPSEPPEAQGNPDRPVRIAMVTDGTSNTVLLGEKWLRPSRYLIGDWMDDQNFSSAHDQDSIRVADVPPVKDTNNNPGTGAFVTDGTNNPCCDYWRDPMNRSPSPRLGSYFGGAHPGGMSALMADGAVRSINWNVTQPVFYNLGNKEDGNAVTLD
jgi:hypothetical protein